MRVIHVTKTGCGGAGIAARRTVTSLQASGIEAELWTAGSVPALRPASETTARWILDKIDSIPTRFYFRQRRFATWSNNWLRTRAAGVLNATNADIIHFHWIGQGLIHPDDLHRIRRPVVWTLHDAWPFTGGCHYPGPCERYVVGCGVCPQLGSTNSHDLSAANWLKKRASFADVKRWVFPSRWLAAKACGSSIVPDDRIRVIPNTLDTRGWAPRDQQAARTKLGLPLNSFVCAAGAMDVRDVRKGCAHVPAALAIVARASRVSVVLLLFGSGGNAIANSGIVVHSLGAIHSEEQMSSVFNAADVVLVPSLQDNLPNVALEAQASGCPVVGFLSGGLAEIVENERTGLLAEEFSPESLARALTRWRELRLSRDQVVSACVQRFQARFAPDVHARSLTAMYREVLSELNPAAKP